MASLASRRLPVPFFVGIEIVTEGALNDRVALMAGPLDLPSDPALDLVDFSDAGDPSPADAGSGSRSALEAEIAVIRSSEAGERFTAKRAARRAGLARASAAAGAESQRAFGVAHQIGDRIPFGQPVLRGHHSQRRHERDLARIDQSMRRGVEASVRSEDLALRSRSVGSAGVSSDDPAAVAELRLKLVDLEAAQAQGKAVNAAIRRAARGGPPAQIAALVKSGLSEDQATHLLQPDFAGRIGVPSYVLSNRNAEIGRVKKRIAELGARAQTSAREPIHGSIEGLTFTMSENKDANRTQIRFSDRPSAPLCARLRSAGFVWAPSETAWQRQLSNQAWHRAGDALGVRVG